MKKILIILYCLVFSIGVHGYTYYEDKFDVYSETKHPIQSKFESTSSYVPVISYQTVKPIEDNGFVSDEYTTNPQPYKNGVRRSLDLDEDDEPIGGMVPIGDIPYMLLFIFLIVYIFKKRN